MILVSITGKKPQKTEKRLEFQVGSMIVSNYPLLWISAALTGYFLMYEGTMSTKKLGAC